jgi:hypothetical protein
LRFFLIISQKFHDSGGFCRSKAVESEFPGNYRAGFSLPPQREFHRYCHIHAADMEVFAPLTYAVGGA